MLAALYTLLALIFWSDESIQTFRLSTVAAALTWLSGDAPLTKFPEHARIDGRRTKHATPQRTGDTWAHHVLST